ncbi:MAG: pitrilysin family protein [Bdellovibrionota bacterium]
MQHVERRLPSGVKVVVSVDRRLPIACVVHLFGVGYLHEPDHLVGISHFLEHLCFKRSSVKNLGELVNDFRAIGAVLEAGTAYDHTYFSCLMPSQNLGAALRLQSEMVRVLDFDADEIESEKNVVLHELDQKMDQPARYLWEKLLELSYEQHPIRRWRMGQRSQIQSISPQDVMEFHQQHYRPENLVISVVGDVDPSQVIDQISAIYNKKAGVIAPMPQVVCEPPQIQPRLARFEGSLSHALAQIGFHAPSMSDRDYLAMECFHVLLGKGKHSRLHNRLVAQEVVYSVDTSYFVTKDLGFVAAKVDLSPSKISVFEEAFFREIEAIKTSPPSVAELDHAKRLILSSRFNEKEDLHSTTYKTAYLSMTEQLATMGKDLHEIMNIQPRHLFPLVDRYLSFSQASIVEYVPKENGPGAFPEWRLESLKKRVDKPSPESAESSTETQGLQDPMFTDLQDQAPVQSSILENERISNIYWNDISANALSFGATLIHLPKTHSPMGHMCLAFPGGRLNENYKNAGITNFMLECFVSQDRSMESQEKSMGGWAGSIDVDASADFFYLSGETLDQEFDQALQSLVDTVKHRHFSPSLVENQKLRNRLTSRQIQNDLLRRSVELYYQGLYGAHPYGLPRYGTPESVASFSEEQLQDWYDQSIDWSKAVFVCMTSTPVEKVKERIEGHFCDQSYAKESKKGADILPVFPPRKQQEMVEMRIRNQTGLTLGVRGSSMNEPAFYAFEILRNVMAGMGGRLYLSLREVSSLAYSVTAFNLGLLRSGAFFSCVSTKPEYEDEVIERLKNMYFSLTKFLISPQEFEASKQYALGSFLNGLQRSHSVAYQLIQRHFYGCDLNGLMDYKTQIESITREQVLEISSQSFQEGKYALGIVRGVQEDV